MPEAFSLSPALTLVPAHGSLGCGVGVSPPASPSFLFHLASSPHPQTAATSCFPKFASDPCAQPLSLPLPAGAWTCFPCGHLQLPLASHLSPLKVPGYGLLDFPGSSDNCPLSLCPSHPHPAVLTPSLPQLIMSPPACPLLRGPRKGRRRGPDSGWKLSHSNWPSPLLCSFLAPQEQRQILVFGL